MTRGSSRGADVVEHKAMAERLFEGVGDMVCMLDLAGRFTWVNRAGEGLTGFRAEELVGKPAVEVIAPEVRGDAVRQFRARLQDGVSHPPDESVLLRRDGTRLPIEVASIVLEGDDGPAAVLGLVRDLGSRRQAEEALLQSEERFRSAFRYAAIGMALAAPDGRYLQVNDALCAIVGYSAEELLERTFQDITHPDDLDADLEHVRQLLAGEIVTYQMEKRYYHRLGHVVWVLLSVSLVRASDASPVHFISQVQDITERKRAEEAIVQSEARLAEAQQIAHLGSWEWDVVSGAVNWSDELYRIFGADPETTVLSYEGFLRRVHPDDRPAVEAAVAHALETGSSSVMEYRVIREDGSVRWVQGRREPIRDGGRTVRLSGTFQDITERKDGEAKLREAERRYRTLVEQLPLATYIRPIDMTRPNLYASPQVEQLLGYSAEEWQTNPDLLAEIVHPDDRDRVLAEAAHLRQTGEPIRDEYRYIARDGRVVWVQDETYLVHDEQGEPCVQGYLLDITERKRAEEERDGLWDELHHAQKLEAIGQLAGGIAHDFNNTLTAIRGYADLLASGVTDGGSSTRYVEEIRKTAEAGAALPRQLLAFGRRQPLELTRLELNEVVADSCELLRPLLGEHIELAFAPGPDVAVVSDRAQLGQALLNLALNARDAMPEGGRLILATRTERLDDATAARHQAVPGTAYAVVSARDTGVGMDAETRRRAFEPFFTTKEEGTGLGLATLYGIARQSGGFVAVESEPAAGSTFEIYLPCEPDSAAVEASPEASHRATVLVAEDEDAVRGLVREVLELADYRVVEAANGIDALVALEGYAGDIDALVTDLKMPGMGGLELARRIREARPGLPTVAISAYSDSSVEGEDVTLLAKPFSARDLTSAVGDAVNGGRPGNAVASQVVSVLVADDHPPVLDAVSRVLETRGFRVVGTATDGDTALRRIVDRRPNVALVDIRMSGLDGVEVARRASELAPRTAVVLYTGRGDRELLRQALDAGARGFLLKDASLDEVARVLRHVAGGEVYVDPGLADSLVTPETVAELPSLTPRERQVLGLLAEGMTNERAASELSISPETIQTHVRKAMAKLHADTRTAAVATALRLALIA